MDFLLKKFFRKEPVEPQEPVAADTVIMMGNYAESLLNNPAFKAAVKKVEADLFNAWKKSAPKDADNREKLYYMLEAIAQVQIKLNGMFNNMVIERDRVKNKAGNAE